MFPEHRGFGNAAAGRDRRTGARCHLPPLRQRRIIRGFIHGEVYPDD